MPSFLTPTQRRTKRAILEAAARILPADRHASIAQVLEAADVSRSTFHRYFSDRNALLRALAEHAYELCTSAISRSTRESHADFDPIATLRRIIREQLEIGPLMTFVYQEPAINVDREFWYSVRAHGDPIDEVLLKVAVTPTLPLSWIRRSYWNTLSVGWETELEGALNREETVEAVIRTLTAGVFTTQPLGPRETT